MPADATAVIRDDHREIEALWRRVNDDPGDGDNDSLGEVIRRVTIHDSIETELLYPRLERLPGGKDLAGQAAAEHQEVVARLSTADRTSTPGGSGTAGDSGTSGGSATAGGRGIARGSGTGTAGGSGTAERTPPAEVAAAMDDLLRHFAWEETAVLPLLQQCLSADEQRLLGERLGAAKSATPTRPHPRLRSREGLGGGRAVLAGVVDRAREWVGRHPNG